MKYAPASAAACLKSQGSATKPHSAGQLPPGPVGGRGGAGMGYGPAKAAGHLGGLGREKSAPSNSGPMKS